MCSSHKSSEHTDAITVYNQLFPFSYLAFWRCQAEFRAITNLQKGKHACIKTQHLICQKKKLCVLKYSTKKKNYQDFPAWLSAGTDGVVILCVTSRGRSASTDRWSKMHRLNMMMLFSTALLFSSLPIYLLQHWLISYKDTATLHVASFPANF